MTVARRQTGSASATYNSSTTYTSLAVSLPAAAVANNLLVAVWVVDKGSGSFTAPTGWTTLVNRTGASVSMLAAYKLAAGGEATVSASWVTASFGSSAIITEYSGVDTSTPLGPNDLSSYSDTPRTSLAFAPATPTNSGLAAAFLGIDTATSAFNVTATGYTQVTSVTAAVNSGSPAVTLAEKATAAGTANSPTFSWTDSDQVQGVLLQINAAAGAVPTTFTVNSRVVGVPGTTTGVVSVNTDAASVRLKVGTDAAVTQNVVFGSAVTPNAQGDARLTVSGLTTTTRQFYYRIAGTPAGGSESLDTLPTVGKFRTAPTGATSFNFLFGSCANAADPVTMSTMAARGDDLFFHLGDLYYADGSGTGVSNFRSKFAAKLSAPNHQSLLSTTPSAYTPSDHDSMNDNTGAGDDPTAFANWNQVYREKWPSPASIPATTGVYHTFVWGRVRFIVLDGRSFKSPLGATDNSTKTKLGTVQKQWLKDTITAATEPVIVIAQESPWEGYVMGDDNWIEYSTERTELGTFFAASKKKIVMLGGDMHSLAADDGSHTAGGVALFQAAPFENVASVKGGPFSAGSYPLVDDPNNTYRQYGRVVVTDDGTTVTLAFTGYSSDNTPRVALSTSSTVVGPPPGGGGGTVSFAPLLTESFTGTNGSGWGSNWTFSNTVGSATIQNNSGQITTAASVYSSARSDLTGLRVQADTDVTGTVRMPSTGAEQWAVISVDADTGGTADSANNSYALVLAYADGQYRLRSATNAVNTTVGGANFALTGGVTYGFRLQRAGQTLNARVWDAATTEPTTWGTTYTITGTPLSGVVSVAASNGADGVARSAIYDNITVSAISTAPVTVGYPKVWTGTAFTPKPMKVWNGTAWVQKPVKRWDGTAWVPLNGVRTVAGSGVAMPVGNLPGWTQFIAQDFSTPAAIGTFELNYPNWSQYDGGSDTSANTSRPANRVGLYDSGSVCSVVNSVFDGYLHTGSDGQPRVFALTPPNQTGDIYGRYSVRFKTDYVPQYKIAWLLWPYDDVWAEGELDFPEAGLDGQISGYSHDTTGNPSNNAWAIDTGVAVASGWHTATIEWTPTRLNYILDGVTYSSTDSAAIPTHKMRWVLQTETWIDSRVPDPGLTGHVQIDWLVGYHYG